MPGARQGVATAARHAAHEAQQPGAGLRAERPQATTAGHRHPLAAHLRCGRAQLRIPRDEI